MMERLHAGDTGGVLEMLGMQSRTESEIIGAVNDTLEKELDTLRRTYEFKKTLEYGSDAAKTKALQGYEDRIARLSSRISAIEERIRNPQEQACPICFDTVSSPSITPCCRNVFCFACICDVLRRSCICPLCRSTIQGVQSMQVIGDVPVAPSRIRTKQEEFRAFLRENQTARVLTFSGYDATFDGLSALLELDGIPHATLTGSQARITKLIRQFGEGKYRVLFLNAKNMGAGLNIAAATHVVLYHRMSIETKNQIIGRAMRMGRTEPLQVLHLLHGNEMTHQERQQIQHV
jgi:SNF2 family DNA or RNA helicase